MFFNRPKPKFQILEEPEIGVIDEAIAPNLPGRVKALSSIWPAKIYQPDSQKVHLLPGQQVLVVAIDNITLLVVPI
jgi:membrane protein implicated in regulation of membrane protease activity